MVPGLLCADATTANSPPATETETPGAAPLGEEPIVAIDFTGSGVPTYTTEPDATVTAGAVTLIGPGDAGSPGPGADGVDGVRGDGIAAGAIVIGPAALSP
jgi:hypothetical protein